MIDEPGFPRLEACLRHEVGQQQHTGYGHLSSWEVDGHYNGEGKAEAPDERQQAQPPSALSEVPLSILHSLSRFKIVTPSGVEEAKGFQEVVTSLAPGRQSPCC